MADNIASAVTLPGAIGSVTGDNTGYTLESGEAACLGYDLANAAGGLGFGGGRTAWFKWTAVANSLVTFTTSAGSTGPTIGDSVMTIIDGNNFATAVVKGADDDSAPGAYSLITFTAVAGHTYYIAVDGFNGDSTDDVGYDIINTAEGSFTLSWNQLVQYLCNAGDSPNLASSTVSVDGSSPPWVRDDQFHTLLTNAFKGYTDFSETFRCIPANDGIPSGHYTIEAFVKFITISGNTNEIFNFLIKRNGIPVGPALQIGDATSTIAPSVNEQVNGVGKWISITGDYPIGGGTKRRGPAKIGFDATDALTFHVGNFDDAPVRSIAVQQIRYTLIDTISPGGVPSPATGSDVNINANPAVLFDMREHGGTTGVVSEVDCCDFTVMPNDDIYAVWAERIGFGTSGSYWIILKKWNGSSWTLISNNVWGRGNPSTGASFYRCFGGIAIDNDGTNVYIAFHEFSNTTLFEKVRVFKYNGSTITQLGTDLSHFNETNTNVPHQYGEAGEQGVQLKVSPAGVPWVSWNEWDSNSNFPAVVHQYPFLYSWNGASWIDSNLPFLTYRRNIDPHIALTATVEEFGLNHVAFTFCHHDGVSEYPSCAYQAEWDRAPVDGDPKELEFIYQEYNGSSWGNLVRFTPRDVRSGFHSTAIPDNGHWHEGIGLFDGGGRVYLCAQLGFAVNTTDYPIFFRLKSDGSAFEDVATDFFSKEYQPFDEATSFGGEWGWTTNGIGAICAGKPIVALSTAETWDLGVAVVSLGENGDGVGWTAAKENVDLWGNAFDTSTSVKGSKNSIYLMNTLETIQSGSTFVEILGIWKFDLVGGPIASYSIVSLR